MRFSPLTLRFDPPSCTQEASRPVAPHSSPWPDRPTKCWQLLATGRYQATMPANICEHPRQYFMWDDLEGRLLCPTLRNAGSPLLTFRPRVWVPKCVAIELFLTCRVLIRTPVGAAVPNCQEHNFGLRANRTVYGIEGQPDTIVDVAVIRPTAPTFLSSAQMRRGEAP